MNLTLEEAWNRTSTYKEFIYFSDVKIQSFDTEDPVKSVHVTFENSFHLRKHENQFYFHRCFIINPEVKHMKYPNWGYVSFFLFLALFYSFSLQFRLYLWTGLLTPSDTTHFEVHEAGHSSLNHDLIEKGSTHWIYQGNFNYDLRMQLHIRVPTKNYQCDPQGSTQPHNCVNEFYMEKLNCSFPWMMSPKFEKCNSNKDLDRLIDINVALHNLSGTMIKELRSKKCW